jgi:hypothetical protein
MAQAALAMERYRAAEVPLSGYLLPVVPAPIC